MSAIFAFFTSGIGLKIAGFFAGALALFGAWLGISRQAKQAERARGEAAAAKATTEAVRQAQAKRKEIANETDAALADLISKPRRK
jgi:hypothetical protein